jgi:hypothetical protein
MSTWNICHEAWASMDAEANGLYIAESKFKGAGLGLFAKKGIFLSLCLYPFFK